MTVSLTSSLSGVVRARAGAGLQAWLDTTGSGIDDLCNAYTCAPKHVGRAALSLTDDERRDLADRAAGVSFERWTIDDVARAALLIGASERFPPDSFAALATECFARGDSREQQSWLRGVCLLPAPERFLALVIDACRTNILPLFESIACENPYPARYFPDRNFNQLVLKALFNGVALKRVVGLQARLNAELSRMAADYAAERRAAGRATPADISLAMLEATGVSKEATS